MRLQITEKTEATAEAAYQLVKSIAPAALRVRVLITAEPFGFGNLTYKKELLLCIHLCFSLLLLQVPRQQCVLSFPT